MGRFLFMSIAYDRSYSPKSVEWHGTALALVVPPLEVWRRTRWSSEFWINLGLTLTAWFPGIMHALWISQREGVTSA